MHRVYRTSGAAALVLISSWTQLGFAPSASGATTIQVTTTADELNTDGDCSLREAVTAANTDTDTDECPAGSGTDTIRLRAGTYALTEDDPLGDAEENAVYGDLDLLESVSIRGRGPIKTIINGNDIDRIFDLHTGGSTITELRIRNGEAIGFTNGGAVLVRNGAFVNLTKVNLSNNRTDANGGAVAVTSTGSAVIDRVTISGNSAGFGGGGMFNNNNTGTALHNVTISGNDAGVSGGGGLYSFGGTITNSTISGNDSDQDGGGIFVDSGILTIRNSTITNNTADLDENNVGNGGGILWETPGWIGNSIVANNTDTGLEAPDCFGSTQSLGHNLIESTTGCPMTGDTASNVTGEDPKLGPLANNGGPTFTHALLPSSPAIGAGADVGKDNAHCTSVDQRGVPRQDCEIGAYERVLCRGVTVNRVGTNLKETLVGTKGKDGFIAAAGNDTLKGLAGADSLCGQGDNDRLLGGRGADILDGGPGSDTGKGGPGTDRCLSIETKIGPCPKLSG